MTTSSSPSDDDSCQQLKLEQAARLIKKADFLLIATGAGFSADSGLPTYADVAKNPIYERLGIEYGDLCRLQCVTENPRLFYGFWGTCFNLYQRQVKPHAGYRIIMKWCQEKQAKLQARQLEGLNTASYLYTSNVDGHFRLAGFPEKSLHEVHGAIDTWLPVVPQEQKDGTKEPTDSVESYSVPGSYSFPVDPETLEGPYSEYIFQNLCHDKNMVQSTSCTAPLLRPRVLMFDDGFPSHTQMGLDSSCERYQKWEEAMESAMETSTDMELVVLEIGCGTRVPSVRIECQDVIQDTAARCKNRKRPCCSFIRINPDQEQIPNISDNVMAISIRGTALSTLLQIEEYIKADSVKASES
jgi:NAD-dependent SIR2 family protein deacetylase